MSALLGQKPYGFVTPIFRTPRNSVKNIVEVQCKGALLQVRYEAEEG
jgi:hypothetical protein